MANASFVWSVQLRRFASPQRRPTAAAILQCFHFDSTGREMVDATCGPPVFPSSLDWARSVHVRRFAVPSRRRKAAATHRCFHCNSIGREVSSYGGSPVLSDGARRQRPTNASIVSRLAEKCPATEVRKFSATTQGGSDPPMLP